VGRSGDALHLAKEILWKKKEEGFVILVCNSALKV